MSEGETAWIMRAGGAVTLAVMLLVRPAAAAQKSEPPKPAPAPAAPAPDTSKPAAPPYNYAADGRRDPFISLVARGTQPTAEVKGPVTGVSGMTTGEISVRGVVQTRGTYVAMIQGPDSKTYIVHVNDRLIDGVIKQITPQGIVVLQEINDPLSTVKQREIRKNLRSAEEGK